MNDQFGESLKPGAVVTGPRRGRSYCSRRRSSSSCRGRIGGPHPCSDRWLRPGQRPSGGRRGEGGDAADRPELRVLKDELDALNGSLCGVGTIAAGLDPDALIAAWCDRLGQLREQVRPATYDYQTKRQLLSSLGMSATIHRTFRTPNTVQEGGQMLVDPHYTLVRGLLLQMKDRGRRLIRSVFDLAC